MGLTLGRCGTVARLVLEGQAAARSGKRTCVLAAPSGETQDTYSSLFDLVRLGEEMGWGGSEGGGSG